MESSELDEYLDSLRQGSRANATIENHRRWVTRFLGSRPPREGWGARMVLEEVERFLASALPTLSRHARSAPLTALRGFLGFLYRRGYISTDLSGSLFGPRIYSNEFLPKGLPRHQVRRVLEQVDRSGPNGLRDYAIIMLLSTYGLRASEVASLRLDSINWRNDTLRTWRPKTTDYLTLPLLPEVGNAIIEYLRERVDNREPLLFPFPSKNPASAVTGVARKYLRKAGLLTAGRVTHLFRHSLGMELVARRIPIRTIGGVLGHRQLVSTSIYAKCDIEGLREAALPVLES